MSKPQIVDATFTSPDRLNIVVKMDGAHWTFASGKLGFLGSDLFEWNGKSWKIRFQAFVRTDESETIHGLLRSDREPVVQVPRSDPGSGAFGRALEHTNRQRERREAGWSIRSLPGGVSALCDLPAAVLTTNRGGFADFHIRLGDYLYLCQFFIKERVGPSVKPTSWDWSKGAKAGLPSLGKRR